jgi:hypothetical protein
MSSGNVASLREVVSRCFSATRAGRSTDEVVIDDRLNSAFIEACRRELPGPTAFDFNWALYNLRKQRHGINDRTTDRRRCNHDDYLHAAEIAARHMEDRCDLTVDRVLCDPDMRREFDALAQAIAPVACCRPCHRPPRSICNGQPRPE